VSFADGWNVDASIARNASMQRIVSEEVWLALIRFLQRWPMESAREPTLCKCKRGATAVHCYGCVTIDRCGTGSSAGQACKLVKPSNYACTAALGQTVDLCRTAAGDDCFRSFASPNCFSCLGINGFLNSITLPSRKQLVALADAATSWRRPRPSRIFRNANRNSYLLGSPQNVGAHNFEAYDSILGARAREHTLKRWRPGRSN